MHKALDLNTAFPADIPNLGNGELTRQHHTRETELLKRLNTCNIMYCHLRARVKRHLRHNLLCQPHCTEILQENRIRSRIVEKGEVLF